MATVHAVDMETHTISTVTTFVDKLTLKEVCRLGVVTLVMVVNKTSERKIDFSFLFGVLSS